MKAIGIVFFILISAFLTAAAPFQNLGFDEAITNNLDLIPPPDRWINGDGMGPASEMLPGWHVFSGTNELKWIGLNLTPPGYDYVTLFSTNPPQPNLVLPLEGRYSLELVPYSYAPYSLIQEGEIPGDSKSIHMVIYGTPVQLEVNGSLVPLFYTPFPFNPRIASYLQPTNAVGDISQFAGQTVELKFIAISEFAKNPYHGLDSIYFSTEAIPEPAVGILLLTGLILLATAWRGRKGDLRNRGIAKVSRCMPRILNPDKRLLFSMNKIIAIACACWPGCQLMPKARSTLTTGCRLLIRLR